MRPVETSTRSRTPMIIPAAAASPGRRPPVRMTAITVRFSASGPAKDSLILGSPRALAHVQTFGALVDDVIRDIGAGAS
jgi:hypothetical protein